MKVVVVYDSVFGNTAQVAEAVADGIRRAMATKQNEESVVRCMPVGEANEAALERVGLLAVGSPTRAFSPTPAITAVLKQPWLSLSGVRTAAFDTRVDIAEVSSRILSMMARLFGYAAPTIAKLLQRRGGTMLAEPEGFIVLDKEGPMRAGQLERASEWGAALVSGS